MEAERKVVLVCGGRKFRSWDTLTATLDEVKPTVIVTGGARGADTLAESYARSREIPFHVYPARWKQHGRSAGPIRNMEMLKASKPDLVVAFPGGRGTAHMIATAQKNNVPVLLHRYEREE